MRLRRLFFVALVTGAFAVLGCGDDQNASEVCAAGDAQSLRGECERIFNPCVETGDAGSHEDCAAAGLAACGVL